MSMPASLNFRAMGSAVLLALDTPIRDGRIHLEEAAAEIAHWETILSRFQATSELSRLNRNSGHIKVSSVLWQVLEAAQQAAEFSEGMVVPTVLDALEHAGYDRDFAQMAQNLPDSGRAPYMISDWRNLKLKPGQIVEMPLGMRLDLGGIAKGWAADTCVAQLGHYAPTLVDIGGDIAVSAPQRNGEPWLIGVADPHGGDEPLVLLELTSGGVATSGRDYRRWRQGDVEQHHIIDPRSGLPADTDLLSATVIAPNAQRAETAAKTVLILGAQAGQAWLAKHPELRAILVPEHGAVIEVNR